MKLLFTFLAVLILLPVQVFSQFNLKGVVKDSVTGQPIRYATIYENGTTNGTISNSEGKFQLTIGTENSEVIFSFVGYKSEIRTFDKPERKEITIQMVPLVIDLNEVDIVHNDLRKKNVEIFEKCFLGYDHWGENAILENSNALIFLPEYKTDQPSADTTENVSRQKKDDENKWIREVQKMKKLDVYAKEPLKIFLPLLGYHLHVDLVNFRIAVDTALYIYSTEYLGYFYYTPDSIAKKSVRRKIEKNRRKAYYNSPMHFCRSLFENKIPENGYLVYDTCKTEGYNVFSDPSSRFIFQLKYNGSNSAELNGLEGTELNILYTDSFGKPIDLTKSVYRKLYFSKIKFKSDTIEIRKNGTIPNKLIMFRGVLGKKLVGASLPSDYEVKL